MESGEIKREESAPLLCVGGQDEVNDQVWREFREAGISATFVRGMVDLGLVDAGYAATTIGAILSDKKLISSTVAVLPLQSGRIVVLGRPLIIGWPGRQPKTCNWSRSLATEWR